LVNDLILLDVAQSQVTDDGLENRLGHLCEERHPAERFPGGVTVRRPHSVLARMPGQRVAQCGETVGEALEIFSPQPPELGVGSRSCNSAVRAATQDSLNAEEFAWPKLPKWLRVVRH